MNLLTRNSPICYFPCLPGDFLERAEMPLFLYGDRVIDRASETDPGIVIGRFYAFDYQKSQWGWRYLVLINQEVGYASTFIYWEQDLEPLD